MDKKNNDDNINISGLEFFLIVIISIIIGAGITLFFIKPLKNEINTDKNVKNIVDVYNNILSIYYEDLDKEQIANGAIKGMLDATGDPYTTYIGDEYSNFDVTINGEYNGIGIEVAYYNDTLLIVGILKDSPAAEIGMEAGDVIKCIDDQKMDITELANYINNTNKETYAIVIERENVEKKFEISKRKIVLKSVTSKTYDKEGRKIGYIYVSMFARNTYSQFKNALYNLYDENIDSLILDLRDNSGGELETLTSMISLFLDDNKIIYQIEDRDGKKEIFYSNGDKDFNYPIMILVNGNTASAAEVMSAALSENLNSKLIGTKTYGKGTVQYVLTADNDSKYKITTSKWLTPNANYINKIGLEPDININSISGEDNQLERAIEELIKK